MKILITDGIEKTGADILLKAGFELTQKTLTPDELLNSDRATMMRSSSARQQRSQRTSSMPEDG